MKAALILPFLLLGLFSQVASAAVPPLSQSAREQLASEIVTGQVVSIDEQLVQLKYGKDVIYTVQMLSDAGEYLSFNYWKAAERPAQWAGPSGQYGTINVGDYIRAYLTRDAETGALKLLSPNGFDLI